MRYPRNATAEQIRTCRGRVETGHVQQLGFENTQAVNSRLMGRQRRRHENETRCDEHVVQSVDGQRKIADDGNRQRRRP